MDTNNAAIAACPQRAAATDQSLKLL